MDRTYGNLARGTAALLAMVPAGVAWALLSSRPALDAAEPAWSVQLHVHGSFSEGVGSVGSHSYEARELGVDAIWWSDHDYRIGSYRHVSHFGFDDWTEAIDRGEEWSARNDRERGFRKLLTVVEESSMPKATARFVRGGVDGTGRSFLVRGQGEGAGSRRLYAFNASRAFHQRPLAAEVTLELAVRPERVDSGAAPIIELGLSEHAPQQQQQQGGRPFDTYHLRYVLVPDPGEPWYEGTVLCIPIRFTAGEWNRLQLPVTRDAAAHMQGIDGADNSLKWIAVGVQAAPEAEVAVRFDELLIRQETRGNATYARQRELLDRMQASHPEPRQLQGVEISYLGAHVNEFSLDTELIDIDRVAQASGLLRGDPVEVDPTELGEAYVRAAVEGAHARGGLVSLNHVFGAGQPGAEARRPRETVLERAVAKQLYGADVLEVGYRDRGGGRLEDYLWVWDRLAERGLRPVGVGVSDSHGGPDHRWRTATNNFVSWILAPSTDKADLLEGLRAGRAYFGDIALFDGRLDLETPEGFRMGAVVVTDRPRCAVQVTARGLESGDAVHVVRRSGRAETRRAEDGEGDFAVEWGLEQDDFVRVEVYSSSGVAKAFSNPIHFVRAVPAGGVPAERIAFDLGGVRVRAVRGFAASSAEVAGGIVRIGGRAEDGSMHLQAARPFEVTLEGLEGRVEASERGVRLEGLRGTGAVVVR